MATIKQIAAETGFSLTTVSLVLNGKGDARSISADTQKKIRQAAIRLGYHPSMSARALREGAANLRQIGLYFSTDYRASMMNRFTNGLWSYPPCGTPDINMIINPYVVDTLSQNQNLKSLSRYHGVILCNMGEADMDYLAHSRPCMPAVLYNRKLEGYSSVSVDNILAGQIPAQVFAKHGRKQAVVLHGSNPFSYTAMRTQAFCEECNRSGIEVLPPIHCTNSSEGGYQHMIALLDSSAFFDCIYCSTDILALGAIRALNERHIHIPDQVEIISIGNNDPKLAEYFWPSLSLVSIPIETMAQECFRLIMEQIEHPGTPPSEITLPVTYIPRESCGE